MLRAARAAGKLRVYVLIKLFAQTGINVHDLTNVTVEAVTAGAVSSGSGPGARTVRLPDKLRQELLEYCRESGIQTGYVFQTQAGGALSRTAVSDSIRVLCRQAGLDDTKSNPRWPAQALPGHAGGDTQEHGGAGLAGVRRADRGRGQGRRLDRRDGPNLRLKKHKNT